MVCLWTGTRVWRTPRKAYKAQIGAKARIKGLADSAMRQNKWAASNAGAAAGLKELSWHRLRRIVGPNPWGEQLLLRIKLHAISTYGYNPVTAGMGCPHQGCERIGRVDLQHVFWDCVAARTLREVLLGRWAAAGLKLKSFEEAIFALALPTLPTTLTRLTGQYVATLPDAQAAALGGLVDQMLMNCWSIGAALYLLSVWRWRVAHFDALNDVTTAYHTAGLRQRLYHGYTDAIRDYPTDIPPHIGARLSSIICGALGGGGDACPASPAGASPIYLILIAGTRGGTTRKCSSGTVILRLRPGFGTYRVVRVGYARYVGTTVTLSQSVHLGLLRGLRRCISNHWVPAHVLGDHPVALRQLITRTPPRAPHLHGDYWKTRRLADAADVPSWLIQDREYNCAAQALARVAQTAGHDMEWQEHEWQQAGTRWDGVKGHIGRDVKRWLREFAESTESAVEEATVYPPRDAETCPRQAAGTETLG
ncbi:hypothetical protein PF003_g11155 [Phytophthora fragariae]|nr:hypothetical protein PF003_g11155 [Phytophthora fragariae]